jgi:hypothetical protein
VSSARDPWLRRLERDTLVVGAVMALAAAAAWPDRLERCLGVLGGLALIALSYRGILGIAGTWMPPSGGATPGPSSDAPRPAGGAIGAEPPSDAPDPRPLAPSGGFV